MDRYKSRGVSSQKEDVHNAIKNVDKGLFPGAFCKIVEDVIGGEKEYCNIMHADGAGTKSSLAYVYYKETGDLSVFKGIATDALVMNIDDLLCVGCVDNFLVSNTIGRNSHLIPGEVIKAIIEGFEESVELYNSLGITMKLTGGETADVGDLVKTLIVDSTVTARMKKEAVISGESIKPGQVILGLSSSGQASFEKEYNSGIGSNGLTSARHDLFSAVYKEKYPESFNADIPDDLCYSGPFLVTDKHDDLPVTVGKAVLSPTRTYAPVIKQVVTEFYDKIGGIIHCSGGAQTKCLKFGSGVHYIKDNLFEIPPLFSVIKEITRTSYKEMYQVFNMGHRMELYLDESIVQEVIQVASSFNIEAKVVGRIEKADNNTGTNNLSLTSPEGVITY